MRLTDYLAEGLDDRGIFKALFIVGIPGAGKSYTTTRLKGTISPVVINTDIATMHAAKKLGVTANPISWLLLRDTATRITKSKLALALVGALPLIVDGTSSDASNVLHRAGILEGLGYDVGMIAIDTDLDVALKRTAARAAETGREVSVAFVQRAAAIAKDNHDYFAGKFDFFKRLRNDGELDDEALLKLFKQVQAFYAAPIKNPVGTRAIDKLKAGGAKVLVPTIISKEALEKRVDSWYRS